MRVAVIGTVKSNAGNEEALGAADANKASQVEIDQRTMVEPYTVGAGFRHTWGERTFSTCSRSSVFCCPIACRDA